VIPVPAPAPGPHGHNKGGLCEPPFQFFRRTAMDAALTGRYRISTIGTRQVRIISDVVEPMIMLRTRLWP